jgi:hypothetical protein
MQIPKVRNSFLLLTSLAIASVYGGLITACSVTTPESKTPNTATTKTDALNYKQMKHDGDMMNHGGGMKHKMEINLGPADTNYDLRFIDAMIPHHQGGVKMAKQALEKSKRPEVKKLAAEIIKAQDQEIAELKQWRKTWYASASITPMTYDPKTGKTIPMSDQQRQGMMMDEDLGSSDADDLQFINAMIPHHEGAIKMAEDALNKSKRPEIKKLATSIINSQQAEINQMKQLTLSRQVRSYQYNC